MVVMQGEQARVQDSQTEWASGAEVEARLDLPAPAADQKVLRGKDGWLFLAHDSNDVLGQHAGTRLLTDLQVQQWQDLLEARTAWLSVEGIPYAFLIAPDPHAVYADMLPEGVPVGKTRPVLQVLEHLEQRESWAPVLYPLSALVEKRDEIVFPKTGTHWTEYGAYLAYRELMAMLTENLPVRTLSRRDLHLSYEERAGDLGHRFDPPIRDRYVYVDVIDSGVRLVHDNRVRNRGRLVEFASDAPNGLTCLVFGDSYAVRMVPLIAESFKRTFWAHTHFDYELVRELRPDAVVTVACERFLIVVQSDAGPGIRRLEAQKRTAGDMMEPRNTESLRINGGRPSMAPKR